LHINNKKFILYKIKELENGDAKMILKDKKGNIATLSKDKKILTYKPKLCEDIILNFLKQV